MKGQEVADLKTSFFAKLRKYLSPDNLRKYYGKAFEFHPNKLDFYKQCIEYETSQQKVDLLRVRQLFEFALSENGKKNDDLWLDFIKWEMSHGNTPEANSLYYRAKKTLANVDDFIVKHSTMMNSEDPEKTFGAASSRAQVESSESSSETSDSDSDSHSDEAPASAPKASNSEDAMDVDNAPAPFSARQPESESDSEPEARPEPEPEDDSGRRRAKRAASAKAKAAASSTSTRKARSQDKEQAPTTPPARRTRSAAKKAGK